MEKGNAVVHVGENAFLSILIGAIESFPSKYEGGKKPRNSFNEGEIYGLLFGQKSQKGDKTFYNVTLAVPLQVLMEKNDSSVTPSGHHFEKIRSIVESVPMYQFLGTFHSHPYPRDQFNVKTSSNPSEIDVHSMLSDANVFEDDLIEVIIALTHLTKTVNKGPEQTWNSIQNYCGNYKYVLAAYITERQAGLVRPVDNLLCPFASGLGNYDLER